MGQRARSARDKEGRRDQIRAAAGALLDAGRPVAAVTMAEVAAAAGLAKGTAYLYHATKEALFLDVAAADLEAWLAALFASLRDDPPCGPDALAGRLVDTLIARPRLVGLLAELHATLEQNLDVATARAFKLRLAALLADADAAFLPHHPRFVPGDGARLLLTAHALVVGFAGMSRPAPAVAAALAEPGLAGLRVDLPTALRGALQQVLRGW